MKPSPPWVVIPTYQEKENIAAMLPALTILPLPHLHILIVDDSSPDGTATLVREFASTHPTVHLLVRPQKKGLGTAYIHGFTYALQHGAGAIVQMDADFSHDPADVGRLLRALEKHDLVLGSRYSHGISVINWPLRRLLISIAGNLYARLVTGLPYKDLTGGFKAWRAGLLNRLDLPSVKANGYAFQIVTTARAHKKGALIKEIPIIFTERREGQSKMNNSIIREAITVVWRLRLLGR